MILSIKTGLLYNLFLWIVPAIYIKNISTINCCHVFYFFIYIKVDVFIICTVAPSGSGCQIFWDTALIINIKIKIAPIFHNLTITVAYLLIHSNSYW